MRYPLCLLLTVLVFNDNLFIGDQITSYFMDSLKTVENVMPLSLGLWDDIL